VAVAVVALGRVGRQGLIAGRGLDHAMLITVLVILL